MADQTGITPEGAFQVLKDNTVEAIKSYFPFDGKNKRLIVENVHVDDKLSSDDITAQTEVKDKDGTWGVPIRATLKLVNKHTGEVLDEKKNAVLGRLPKLTNRYSYIVNGSEYQVDHLFRLRSGVYTRVQNNGELETEFNLAKSPTGRNFSLHLDPATKKMSMLYGDAKIPLYPLMKTLGVADDDLEKSWGSQVLAANKPATDKKTWSALASFYKRTGGGDPTNFKTEELAKHVHDFFAGTKLRPDTTKLTLGEAHEQVTGKTLFQAAHKLLGVSRGTHQPDDRDSLAFKEVAGIEDFIPERLARTKTIKARLRQNLDSKTAVGEILSADVFNRPIHEFFTKGTSVTERSDQTNPIQMLSAHRKTTLMAKDFGGIKSDKSLTLEMRAVNQSHLGFLDPMHTPESERTGITLHLAANVRKNGKDLEIPVYDLKDKRFTWVNATEFHTSPAILPDQVQWKNGKPVPVADKVKMKLSGGDIEERDHREARYILHSAKGMFNYASNLIPFLPTNNGNRVMMADKQLEQAIGLKHREVPLVQSKTDHPTDPSHTFERFLGHFVAARSPVEGTVAAVKDNLIKVRGADGKLHDVHIYKDFPLNDSKGMLHSEPLVKPGDKVGRGQVLADNNYTKGGDLAIGTNLRVGYVPYKGYNFEDGIVISEGAAKRLTSEHLHKKHFDFDADRDEISMAKFNAFATTRKLQMKAEHRDALDDNGVIKVGTRVEPGQVMVAAVSKNDPRKASFLAGYNKKRAFQPYRDKSLVWDEDHVGTVTKVIRDPSGGVKVYVRTEEPAVVGDKLTGRHGNKGIITQIIKDEHMPFTVDKDGKRRPLEILLNPTGVPTRINPGQMLETAAAKIAEKTGKPYIVNNFAGPKHDYRTEVESELKKHGLSDEEHVYDPADVRKPIGSVTVGPQYILKLKHQVEKKLQARGALTDVQGAKLPVDNDRQPVKGGDKGGQGVGALELYALLGHDARHNIREMATYKSDQQDALFWSMIQQGHEPPPPKPPFSYNKFVGLLQGLGVNVDKQGTAIRIHPMNNKEVLRLADNGRNEIKTPKALISKNLEPYKGGLFDKDITGGLDGDKWSYIRLSEPMPNPVFVGQNNRPGPIPTLLGMKIKQFESLMNGTTSLGGLTGGHAVEAALKKVDVEKEIAAVRKELPNLRTDELDRANRKLKYLLALKEHNLKPHEAYVMHYVPVLPPKFRPASPTPDGSVAYSPLNGHYKNIGLLNEKLTNFDTATFTAEHKQPLRAQLWDALKGLQAVGNYKPVYDVDSSGNRDLAGILDIISKGGTEGQPKEGYFQAKVLKKRQNLSMRSTIIPEPALHLDEVGLPRDAAMEMFKPYVVAQLVKWGQPPLKAQEEIKKGTDVAKRALQAVVADRPVLLKRDPVLHKFGVMAFKPKLVDGKAIQIHPLVTGGYNADFDGDSVDLDTPIYLRINGNPTMKTGREIIDLLNVPDGNWVSETRNIDAWTYNGWRPVKNFSFHNVEEKKKYRITLKNGVSFVVSEDHSLMVGRKETKPGTLTLGTELDHVNVEPKEDLGSYDRGVAYGNFLGDGCAEVRPGGGGRISIACKPDTERSYLREIWEAEWDVHTTDSPGALFQVSNVDLARHFLFVCGRYCDGKYVGDALLAGSREFLKGLLAGYILSDGSVELTKSGSFLIRTWSRSKALRDGMSFVANMLGLPHSLRERVAKGETNYLISFGKEAIKLIDYRCPGKKGDLIKLARSEYENNRNDDRRSLGERGFEVQSIEEVEYRERMIDLEVDDESHVFTIHGGVVLHNTMGVSVPMSREAVEEAKRLLPSKNLFSPTNYSAMYTPGHEALLGLHLLTKWGKQSGKKFGSVKELDDAVSKGHLTVTDVVHVAGFSKPTTYGRLLVESSLPRSSQHNQAVLHDANFVITKKTLREVAGALAKKDPSAYPTTIDGLKNLGNEWSFKLGFSFGLKDLATLPERDKIIAEYSKKAEQATKGLKDKAARDEALIKIWSEATSKIEEAQKDLAHKGNRLATMVASGARGDTAQLRQMVAAPMLMEDTFGRTIPNPLKRSFSEGLDVGDFWMYQHGARKGTIQRSRGTAEPGAITKDIINAAMSTLIVSPDCKTTQGVSLKVTDPDIHDRYTAVPYKLKGNISLPAGTLLTTEVLDKLRAAKHEKISVRSPLKCAHGEGLCAKCYGLSESGQHHGLGTNIGILASQSMGEPSTQLSMNSFHTGGVAQGAGAKSIDAITRLRNLLEMPGTLRDEATVARESGKITAIHKDPAGGLDVHINGVRHYIPHRLVPKTVQTDKGEHPLAVGVEVKKGDQLSGGFVNPHHLLSATKDIHTVQNYLTNELHGGLFGKLGVRRRNVEVAVRSITNLAKVKDPGHSDWDHGDVVPRTVIEEHNRNLPKGHPPVSFEPILKGTGEIPHLITKDWLQRLNYQELHTTIQQAASQGQKSEIHGLRPIPGIAFGAEFGKPPPGHPKHHY